MKPRRKYDREFKQMAVELIHHREDISKLAEEIWRTTAWLNKV